MMMTNYNDGEWHAWGGGECPVHPKSHIDIVTISALQIFNRKARITDWDSDNPFLFRVVKEHKEPSELWATFDKEGVWTWVGHSNQDRPNAVLLREVTE